TCKRGTSVTRWDLKLESPRRCFAAEIRGAATFPFDKEVAMKRWRFVYLGAVVPALLIGLGLWSPLKQAVAKDPNKAPRFKVDPSWPKPLPTDTEPNPAAATAGYRKSGPGASKPWVTAQGPGDGTDSKDHA